MKKIEVKWSYPVNYKSAIEHELALNKGLYQITRKFGGNESLLYIGISTGEKQKIIKRRLEVHESDWLNNYRGEKIVRIGMVKKKQGLTIDDNLIKDIESALILQVQPIQNIQCKSTYTLRGKELEIVNTGYRGFIHKSIKTKDHDEI